MINCLVLFFRDIFGTLKSKKKKQMQTNKAFHQTIESLMSEENQSNLSSTSKEFEKILSSAIRSKKSSKLQSPKTDIFFDKIANVSNDKPDYAANEKFHDQYTEKNEESYEFRDVSSDFIVSKDTENDSFSNSSSEINEFWRDYKEKISQKSKYDCDYGDILSSYTDSDDGNVCLSKELKEKMSQYLKYQENI